jgi:acylglycerol lipase
LILYLTGCNKPEMYKKGLDINSQQYFNLVKNQIPISDATTKTLLENIIEPEYVNSPRVNKEFKVTSFYSGNKRIKYSVWNPASKNNEVIVYLNGLESHGGWFDDCAKELVKKDIFICSLDRRGSGLNAKTYGDYNSWINDVKILVQDIKKVNPKSEINLVSLCFGARVATGYAIKYPDSLNSLIYISPGFETKINLNCFEKFCVGLSGLGINFPINSPIKNDKMFTENQDKLNYMREDLMRTISPNSSTFYQGNLLNELDKKALKEIKSPALVFFAENDKIVDIPKNVEIFLNFKITPKIIIFPGKEHTIFFGENKDKFIEGLYEFIRKN